MSDAAGPQLVTPRDQLAYIIVKARAFDVEVGTSGLEDGSNASDDREVGVLEPVGNATQAELTAAIRDLPDEGIQELVMLTLIGRGDYSAAEFRDAMVAAGDIGDRDLVDYLVGTPLLGDLLAQGLEELGYSPLGEEADG